MNNRNSPFSSSRNCSELIIPASVVREIFGIKSKSSLVIGAVLLQAAKKTKNNKMDMGIYIKVVLFNI